MDAEGRNIQRLETAVRELEGRLCRLREELGVAREERRLALALAVAVEEGEGEGEESVVGSRGDGDRDRYGDEDRDKERQCSATTWSWPMKREEYKRYGRQLIMPEIGIGGQLRLRNSRVLVVGAGGLGCPALIYLAGAGVGTIGLVDGDVVEESNLARQILHTTARVGKNKVLSAIDSAKALNPHVQYHAHTEHLVPETAADIVGQYDVVLDCTDHPTSRYLVSDTCVLLGKPLVSASALRTDGQLLVLNNPPLKPGDTRGGPCYRCIFPKPPPPESLVTCGDGGVLGPVVGVIGVLQALESIKILITESSAAFRNAAADSNTETGSRSNGEINHVDSAKAEIEQSKEHSMLLFSAIPDLTFRTVRIRGRRSNCAACSSSSTIRVESLKDGLLDYTRFCGIPKQPEVINPEERISVQQLAELRNKKSEVSNSKESGVKSAKLAASMTETDTDIDRRVSDSSLKGQPKQPYALIDVRNAVQFDIAHLSDSINIPFLSIESFNYSDRQNASPNSAPSLSLPEWAAPLSDLPENLPIHVVCRRGNDSQVVVRRLKQLGLHRNGGRYVGDIVGGIEEWTKHYGSAAGGFPEY